MKIRNARFNDIWIEKFDAEAKDAWCILGFSHSGMEDFFLLVSGEAGADVDAEILELPKRIGIVSFKKQQELYESELKKDDTDFMDMLDPGTLARGFLKDLEKHAGLIDVFDMTVSLDKGYRQLSTGQSRKLLLLSQIMQGSSCLVIQSPYDGLDAKSCHELEQILFHLYQSKNQLIIFVNNTEDIPSWCTHLGVLSDGRLVDQGGRQEMLSKLKQNRYKIVPDFQASAKDLYEQGTGGPEKAMVHDRRPELVLLNNGFAAYGGVPVFQNLCLTIKPGDHTLVTGPNGSGKSTLLQVITGDHPSCYQNDLKIFGIQRGSGESIWDLKKQMGIVSSDLHRNYRVPGSTLQCVISGLFDSIGLYRPYSHGQEKKALAWLARMNMTLDADTPFQQLEYARQRLVLIARALIKVPELLILDEPTQGIDESNRMAVLDFIEDVAREEVCTILYVSHREDEFRSFFKQQITMG